MSERGTGWEHCRTALLDLRRPVPDDAEGLFEVYGDPRTWGHYPQGRHLEPARTEQMVAEAVAQWDAYGLGYWTVRLAGAIVGWAGCAVPGDLPWWNLAYRFATWTHGGGLGAEAAERAVAAAHDVDPDRPVLAYLLEHNEASRRTAERLGLRLVWRGPDRGNDDPGAVRLVLLDREPTDALVTALAAEGMDESHLV